MRHLLRILPLLCLNVDNGGGAGALGGDANAAGTGTLPPPETPNLPTVETAASKPVHTKPEAPKTEPKKKAAGDHHAERRALAKAFYAALLANSNKTAGYDLLDADLINKLSKTAVAHADGLMAELDKPREEPAEG